MIHSCLVVSYDQSVDLWLKYLVLLNYRCIVVIKWLISSKIIIKNKCVIDFLSVLLEMCGVRLDECGVIPAVFRAVLRESFSSYAAACVFWFNGETLKTSRFRPQVKSVINLLFAAYTGDVSALRRWAAHTQLLIRDQFRFIHVSPPVELFNNIYLKEKLLWLHDEAPWWPQVAEKGTYRCPCGVFTSELMKVS